MDELIQAVVRALGVGASLEDIHDAIISKGWTEDDTFLAIKAGELLYTAIQEVENDSHQDTHR